MKDLISKIKTNRLTTFHLILNDIDYVGKVDDLRNDYYIDDCFIYCIYNNTNDIVMNREIYYRYARSDYYYTMKDSIIEYIGKQINTIYTRQTICNLNFKKYERFIK